MLGSISHPNCFSSFLKNVLQWENKTKTKKRKKTERERGNEGHILKNNISNLGLVFIANNILKTK